jgi:sigma-E factor negative regulatory protein RseC
VIEETARVVRVQGRYAWVQTLRRTACEGCGSGSECGVGAVAVGLWRRPLQLRALNGVGVGEGEQVVVGLNEGALVTGSLAVYFIPLVALLGGALLGKVAAEQWGWGGADGWSIASGLVGLGLGLLWTRRFGLRAAADSRYEPVILRRAKT